MTHITPQASSGANDYPCDGHSQRLQLRIHVKLSYIRGPETRNIDPRSNDCRPLNTAGSGERAAGATPPQQAALSTASPPGVQRGALIHQNASLSRQTNTCTSPQHCDFGGRLSQWLQLRHPVSLTQFRLPQLRYLALVPRTAGTVNQRGVASEATARGLSRAHTATQGFTRGLVGAATNRSSR